MKLYNCCSAEEEKLKKTNLEVLMPHKLVELADDIRKKYRDDVLEDHSIVVDALHQIVEEQARRNMELWLEVRKNGQEE